MVKPRGPQLLKVMSRVVGLCRDWLGYDSIHQELLRYHHRRRFFRRIHDEVLPIAWHPDRFWDWCIDEAEKEFLKGGVEMLSPSPAKNVGKFECVVGKLNIVGNIHLENNKCSWKFC